MFRIFKSLAKFQPAPLQTLSKTSSKSALIPLCNFHKNSNKALSYNFSASFSLTKRPENIYIQDLRLIQTLPDQELSSFQQILKKYITSHDFANFTPEDSSQLLKAFDQLGKVCFETLNREGDALKYYEEALEFAKTKGITDSKEIGFVHNGLAYALYLQGKFDEALKNFEQGQQILEKVGLDGESVYPYIQNIYFQGTISLNKGNIAKAEEYLQIALEANEATPEKDEAFLIDIYENLAYVYFQKNDVENAHKYAKKALENIYKVCGENSGRSATLLRDVASSLLSQGKFDDALSYAKKLDNTLTQNKEADKIEVIESLVLIGKIYNKKTVTSNAVEYGQKALKLCSESGHNLYWLEQIHSLLGTSLFAGGKEAEGLKHFEEAAELCEESGDKSGNLHSHYYLLADAYFKKKDFGKAEDIAKEALEFCILRFGHGSPDSEAYLSLLLKIFEAQNKTEAIAKIREAFGQK